MRHETKTWLAVLLLAGWGCGGTGGGGGSNSAVSAGASSPADASTLEETYENGHPIVVSTTDPHALEREADVVRIVNDYRVSQGLNALIDTASIANVARAHSYHMVLHSFFAHTNPEGDSPGTRMAKGGIGWTMAGENLAAGFATAEDAFNAWMNSPGHKANIERQEWVYTGVGYWYDSGSTYQWYWTQNFTRP